MAHVKVVTARINERVYDDLQYLMKVEHVDQAELLRKLLDKAVRLEKIKLALERLRDHKITIRKAASLANVPYVEMFDLASREGIESGYSLQDVQSYLGKSR